MMGTYFTRSALVFHGFNPASNVAGMEIDTRGRHIITWDEVMQKRRERQREQLWRKREWFVKPMRAYKLYVAYYDQDLMGGWQAMLEDWRGRDYDIWIDRDRRWLEPIIMQAFSLVLPLGTEREQWCCWKPAFAQQFKRRMQDRQPLGVAYLWWNGDRELRAVR
jgi:hypothetical protein